MQQPLQKPEATDVLALTRRLAEACLDRKAEQVMAFDARGLTSFADAFVIASGRSDRQVRAIADAVMEAARAAGETALGKEGYDEGRWVLIDFAEVIVHVFQTDVREHYDLERLWADAPRIDLGLADADGDDDGREAETAR